MSRQHPLQLGEPCCCVIFGLPSRYALEMLNDWVEGAVGVVLRAAKRDPGKALALHFRAQRANESRLANSWFTTDQDDLSALLVATLVPNTAQQSYLFIAPNEQRC